MLNLFQLVLQIAVILVAARIVGFLFQKINQPQVMGEMVAGILLGPSLLGWLAPGASAALFPAASLSYLNALSQVGLVVFMFVVGLALDPSELHGYGHAAVLTSHVSIVAPFCLGGLTALYFYPRLSDDSVTFTHFALFMGAAMSITAFPVLARILTERGLLRSRMGTLAVACAAVDDVTGWCILAYIVVLVRVAHAARPAWVTIAGSFVYVFIMLVVVRRLLPALERAFRKRDHLSDNLLALIVVLVLASALATEWLGIHLLFGAFLMGAIMPKAPDFTRYLLHKFESVTVVLLLPLFFAYTGLRTRIGVGGGHAIWFYSAIVIVVAITGKLGGSMFAARLAGMPWREAAALGVLMNTRGLMELVILNIGLDIGVISQAMFSIMVLMALVTTFMTTPLLEWVYPTRLFRAQVTSEEVHQSVA
ncbi:MAG TPA: cation:proton antiporter [Bryobacteraceae bacterium]|jgi:Kef-type K+ transport system membrane component KefB|nr:cation:proton antiporter [Bryobacteraceae bacterium]